MAETSHLERYQIMSKHIRKLFAEAQENHAIDRQFSVYHTAVKRGYPRVEAAQYLREAGAFEAEINLALGV